jgi:hypothetical protein
MYAFFKRLGKNDSGLTLPEYGIGLALAVGIGTSALALLGQDITGATGAAGG